MTKLYKKGTFLGNAYDKLFIHNKFKLISMK